MSIEVTQLKAHVDKLSEENKKHRCLIEKKDNKIDHLEQKLWGVEEELKLEKQRCQEQLSQVKWNFKNVLSHVASYISPIRVQRYDRISGSTCMGGLVSWLLLFFFLGGWVRWLIGGWWVGGWGGVVCSVQTRPCL